MTDEEKKELIKTLENYASRKMDKYPLNAFREGYNYGLQTMFEIAREIIEKGEGK